MGSGLPEDVTATAVASCPELEPEPAAPRSAPRCGDPALALATALLLPPNRPVLSVAPMMAWTTHHFRQLMRMLTKRTLLYTEMYPADVVLQAAAVSPERLESLIGFQASQRPLAVQLGGRDPERLAAAAGTCAARGYDEVNINVGCPSETVSLGQCYGAALMREAGLVQALAAAVRAAVPPTVAVTIKHRLGVDDHDSWDQLVEFVTVVSQPPASVTQ